MSNLPSRIKAASKRIVIGAASRAIEAQSLAAFLMGRVFFHIRGRAKSAGTDVPATAGSILVIRLDEVGDLVMLSPFLRALRRHFTQAHITLVVNPAIVNLVELCPYVNEVLTFDPRGSQAKRFFYLPLRAFRFASQFLWKRKYDLALLPRRDADCAYATFLGFWSKARQRVGYSENATPYKSLVNRGFDRLLTHVLHDRGVQHEVESNLAVLKSLGIAAAHEDQP
jgi:ADP-heptose:LPS heptosyltransferase